MKHREGGNILVWILVLALAIFLIHVFHSDRLFLDSSVFKDIQRLPCGITVKHPGTNDKITFPLAVDGYANECGWNISAGSAGTVQVFDGKGLPVTAPVALSISSDQTGYPYYFDVLLVPVAAPQTDTGNMLFTSTTGLISSVPISF